MPEPTEPVLTDAETLRAAAAKLRQIAADTTKGPWYSDHDSVYAQGADDAPFFPTVARDMSYHDTLWAEVAGPQIAEPIAAWLEHEGSGVRVDPHALRLARTILTGVDRG